MNQTTQCLVLALCFGAFAAQANSPFVKQDTFIGCTVERFGIPSGQLGTIVRAGVVLPPEYDSSKTYPVLYALHGYGAPWDSWANMSTLAKTLAKYPFIVVVFDGDKHRYIESHTSKTVKYVSFFYKDLIPFVEGRYSVDKTNRSIAGFSMGAQGAMHFALQRPNMFRSVSGLSAFLVNDEALMAAAKKGEEATDMEKRHLKNLATHLGPITEFPERYAHLSVYKTLSALRAAKTPIPPIYLACGKKDRFLNNTESLSKHLTRLGIGHESHLIEGDHNWSFWKGQAPSVLAFHAKHLKRDAN